MPDEVEAHLKTALTYITQGVSIVQVFIEPSVMQYIFTLFGIIVALDAAYFLYSFVFWFLRKLPFTSIRT